MPPLFEMTSAATLLGASIGSVPQRAMSFSVLVPVVLKEATICPGMPGTRLQVARLSPQAEMSSTVFQVASLHLALRLLEQNP